MPLKLIETLKSSGDQTDLLNNFETDFQTILAPVKKL